MLLRSDEQKNGPAVRDLATRAGPGLPFGITPNYDTRTVAALFSRKTPSLIFRSMINSSLGAASASRDLPQSE